jgi:hypothetical protein
MQVDRAVPGPPQSQAWQNEQLISPQEPSFARQAATQVGLEPLHAVLAKVAT